MWSTKSPFLFHVTLQFLFLLILGIQESQVDGKIRNPYDNTGREDEYAKIDAWEPSDEGKHDFRYYCSGGDEDGRPVWVMSLSKWNFNKWTTKGEAKQQEFQNLTEQFRYRVFNSPKYANKIASDSGENTTTSKVDSWVFFADMDGYDLSQLYNVKALETSMDVMRKLLIVSENMEYGFVVNTNFVAERFLNLLKPLMGGMFAKLHIYGTSRQKWLPKVLSKIPRESLPKEFGGKKICSPKSFGKCI